MDTNIFNNTKIAFEWKTNKELRQASFLFKVLAKNSMVKIGKGLTNFALKIKLPIAWAVRRTIYKHFVGGERLEDCDKIIDKFSKYNVKAILDYSVESNDTDFAISQTLEETIKTVENSAKNPNVPFAVFKPSAFGFHEIMKKAKDESTLTDEEKIEVQKFRVRVKQICEAAHNLGTPVMVDAEYYEIQPFIDRVIFEMMLEFNKEKAIVYNTLQMYRKDRLDYLKELYSKAVENNIFVGVKFVRGAYMEIERDLAQKGGYESPIHETKADTDKSFNDALKFAVQNIERFAIFNATHNEDSNVYLTNLMDEYGISKDDGRCYFAQLFGMSDNISFNLAKEKFNVAKYTPYGPVDGVLPYLIRRAEENTAVAGQTTRELNLISKEIKRRKKEK